MRLQCVSKTAFASTELAPAPPPDHPTDESRSQPTRPTLTIHETIRRGDIDQFRSHIHYLSPLDDRDHEGHTPLSIAASIDNIDIVRELIANGANANYSNSDGTTPLMWAASQQQSSTVDILLENGAFVDSRDSKDRTALHAAAHSGNVQAIELLLKHGAVANASIDGQTPLMLAILARKTSAVKSLTESNQIGVGVASPLALAADQGDVDLVKYFLDKGANPNSADMKGVTALHCAAMSGSRQIATLLLDAKANPNSRINLSLGTPLHSASMKGHIEIIELLLDRGADIEAQDSLGKTPLYDAAMAGKIDAVAFLLQKGSKATNPQVGPRLDALARLDPKLDAVLKKVLGTSGP